MAYYHFKTTLETYNFGVIFEEEEIEKGITTPLLVGLISELLLALLGLDTPTVTVILKSSSSPRRAELFRNSLTVTERV